MDPVAEIKMRLPIEQLVAQYCQLIKKGRNFVCLCPFHNDSHPSFLVSPDKGIGYCFACRSGGDIFSFYQKIENVDFAQAIRELAEKAGVTLETRGPSTAPKKDEKDRARECLQAAVDFYRACLTQAPVAQEYLKKRGVPPEQVEQFGIGVAPDSFSDTYEHLLKQGFSRKEILAAGLGVQKELREERIYDRFRHRLMFPIADPQGNLVGFGGRTLGDDDAKYINSSEGILFHKSAVLYSFAEAKEAIRERGKAVLVEGYFDVLACHRAGVGNAVATCGTALTEAHVKLLKRYCGTVVLCMDSDSAGEQAMERAFLALSVQDMHVETVALSDKDPADAVQTDLALFQHQFGAPVPYLDQVLERLRSSDLQSAHGRRQALQALLPLLQAVQSSVERRDYVAKAAKVFATTETAFEQDLARARRELLAPPRSSAAPSSSADAQELFSATEITLGLLLLYPDLRHLLPELIEPGQGFAAALYASLTGEPLVSEHQERAALLQLYCEHHGFHEWSESMALREIRHNCRAANRETLHVKQEEITRGLVEASRAGNVVEQAQLQLQYQQVIRLMKMAS